MSSFVSWLSSILFLPCMRSACCLHSPVPSLFFSNFSFSPGVFFLFPSTIPTNKRVCT
ncbi:hypothetical protein CSUI_006939 [Cystoisospora suis]|uniref:Secreted protein n=1 Tax=Cystoisospora suis TaxID=483139 RepID=A0A2C6KSC6_9APIC|nr:hypothetical protein CSUI_006939 [Cystoisospora suis]